MSDWNLDTSLIGVAEYDAATKAYESGRRWRERSGVRRRDWTQPWVLDRERRQWMRTFTLNGAPGFQVRYLPD